MDTGNKFKNKQQKLFGHEQRKQNCMDYCRLMVQFYVQPQKVLLI